MTTDTPQPDADTQRNLDKLWAEWPEHMRYVDSDGARWIWIAARWLTVRDAVDRGLC